MVVKVFEHTTNSVEFLCEVRELGAVDVGHAVKAHFLVPVGPECPCGHHGAQVRAADADVHDIREALAGMAADLLRLNALDEVLDAIEHFPHVRHAVDFERDLVRHLGAQCRVQDRAVLGDVDFLAREHRLDGFRHLRFPREPHEQLSGCRVDVVLRVVERQVARGQRESGGALFIPGEQGPEVLGAHRFAVMLLQRLPGAEVGRVAGGEFSMRELHGQALDLMPSL